MFGNPGYSIYMVYIVMTYDNGVDFICSDIIQKRCNNSSADVAFVQRACIKQEVGFAGKLSEYCLTVAHVKAGDD